MERKVKVIHKGMEREAVELDFKTVKEEWNIYDLDDGSRIRLKTVISNVAKVLNEFDDDGNPVYIVKASNVLAVSAPDHLRRGADQKPETH